MGTKPSATKRLLLTSQREKVTAAKGLLEAPKGMRTKKLKGFDFTKKGSGKDRGLGSKTGGFQNPSAGLVGSSAVKRARALDKKRADREAQGIAAAAIAKPARKGKNKLPSKRGKNPG